MNYGTNDERRRQQTEFSMDGSVSNGGDGSAVNKRSFQRTAPSAMVETAEQHRQQTEFSTDGSVSNGGDGRTDNKRSFQRIAPSATAETAERRRQQTVV